MNGQMSGEVIHNIAPQANHLQPENVEVLVPMMGNHYVDSKGGAALIINRDGPIVGSTHDCRAKKWNIFRCAEKHTPKNIQAVERGCFYEVGKMVLQYEQEHGGTSLQPPSLQVFYRPLGESESSQSSENSGETGDSGNFSQDETEPNGSDEREKRKNVSENVGDGSDVAVKICPHVTS